MLQSIREYTQGWITKTIISIIILTFALWGIHSYFSMGSVNVNVASVNGVDITKDQLVVAYERLKRQAQAQYAANATLSVNDEAALKERALQALIDIELLKQASNKQGYFVSDRQVDNYLQSMPEFQEKGQFVFSKVQEMLSSALLSLSELLDIIRTSLLIDQPKLGLVFTSLALPNEASSTIELVNQTREIEYLNIPFQYFLVQPIMISAQQIDAYYSQHKNEFMTPEQVNIEYLQLSLKTVSQLISTTDILLKNFYNENINSYTEPTKWKFASAEIVLPAQASNDEIKNIEGVAEKLAKEMAAEKDAKKLMTLAQKYSAHFSTMEWTSLSQVSPEWQKAIAGLTKEGDVSNPFKTSKGIIVIKVLDVQEPKMQPFEVVKDKVKEAYIRQHAEEKFGELREKLADLAYEHPDSLQFVAKEIGLPVQTSELFTKDKPGKGISQYKKIRDTAFSNDVLNLQNNSDVVQLSPDTVVVLRLKSHVASTLLSLQQVSKQIEDKLKVHEAELRCEQFAKNLLEKLQSGNDRKQLATAYKLKWLSTDLMGRYSSKVDTAILDLAFRLPKLSTANDNMIYGSVRVPNGYTVVLLKRVQNGALQDKKQQTVFVDQIQNSEGLLEYELYKRSQMKEAKIKVIPVS